MPTISEIRAQYPQYNDMSDEKLADALHAKYYSDMPKDNFYSKVGMGKGIKGVEQDIKSSISNVPAALVSALSNLPEQVYQSGKQSLIHPIRATENIGAGALEGLKGTVNIPSNIATYLGSKDIGKGSIEDFISKLNIGNTGLQKAVLGSPQPGDELLQGIGSFAPFGVAGGAGKGMAALARRAAANAAYATGQNQNPLTASLMGAATEGLTKGAQKALKPGRFLPSSPLSNSELTESQAITQGTNTGLGDVLQNPFLKRQLENVLPDIWGSGANEAMQNTAQAITSKGQEIMNSLKGTNEETDLGQALQKALAKSELETRKQKDAKFKEVNDLAEKNDVTTSRNNLRQVAQQQLNKIKSDPDLSSMADAGTKNLIKSFAEEKTRPYNYFEALTGLHKPIKNFSLRDTDFVRAELGDKAHDAYQSNNTKLSNVYLALKNAAKKDINEAIDKSGSENLKNIRDNAMSFYQKEYAPFEDRDIMKYTRQGADSDTLTSAFIKTSKIADRSNLLSKLSAKLSPEERQLLSYSYFSRAIKDGQVNPQTIKTLYKALGDRQRKALLSPETDKELGDYSKLVQKNTEPLNLMFNPKTGQRTSSMLPILGVLGGATGALASGSLPAGIVAGLLPNLLGKPAVKMLTSPTVRGKIIDNILKARAKSEQASRNITPLINALTQASQKPMEINVNKYAGTSNP